MKTGEIAKMMGVSAKTITNWTDQVDLAPFFSAPARASDVESSQRDYATDDVLVLNTIRLHKTRQNTWRDVAAILGSGHRETDLPLSATLTKTISPVDQMGQLMLLKNERDTALAQLQDAQFEIDRLRKELENERDRSERRLAEANDKSLTRITELTKQMGRLEERAEALQEKLNKYEGDEQ